MLMATGEELPSTLEVVKEQSIKAPPAIVFEAIFEEIEAMTDPKGRPLQMKVERWPGGRWYRDLGNNAGHLWAHVQVIKPPTLLEFCGPMFMSYPTASHAQYRVAAEGDGRSKLTFTHRAIGLIPKEHRDGVQEGWQQILDEIRAIAERKAGAIK